MLFIEKLITNSRCRSLTKAESPINKKPVLTLNCPQKDSFPINDYN